MLDIYFFHFTKHKLAIFIIYRTKIRSNCSVKPFLSMKLFMKLLQLKTIICETVI